MDDIFFGWLVLCVSGSFASFSIPSDVYISYFSSSLTSQERQAFLSSISQVNLDSYLLPNTTLHIAEVTPSHQNTFTSALNISLHKISSLFVSSKPTQFQDVLSSLLHTPLLSIHPYKEVPSNQSFSDYGVGMWSNPHTAMIELIVRYSWTNVIVLYDVRWRDQATLFVSNLSSNIHTFLLDLVLDQSGVINETSLNRLMLLGNDPAEVIALFCDASHVQGILKQVHPLLSPKKHKSHRWLLADPIESLKLTAEVSQIIIGFTPRVFINNKTTALIAALSTNITDIKFSSFLVFDAVQAYAHALHDMLAANKWQPLINGNNMVEFKNGDELLKCIKKVSTIGTTGVIQFDDGGHRRNAVIDIMNLRGGTFMKIGEWSEATGLTMMSPPNKNRPIFNVVPLSQLQRKLKIAVVEDSPFVMTEFDEQTKSKKLVGFSIDLIDELAKVLKFNPEFYLSPDGKYGGTNPDGSLSGVIGEVFYGKADMSSMPLTISSDRLQYMGFSKPFMHISMDLVMQKPKVSEFDITGFMTPYTINVWIMTLATWFVVTATLTLVNYFSPYGHRLCDDEQDGDEFSWFNSLWFCLASMLQQGGDCTPRMLSGRIVVGSFWFCILVWVSTYTANLAAFLTSNKNDQQINTLHDVVDREYSLYMMKDTALYDYFKTTDYRIYRLLFERMSIEKTFVDSASDGFKNVRKNEKAVYLEESPFADYFINQDPCDLTSAKDVTGSISYGVAMAKDFPYSNNISIAILRMQELGRLEDLKRKWWDYRNKCPVVKRLTSEEIIESKRIQIGSMVGVYILLAVGGVISILVIFFEVSWKKRRDRIHAKMRKGWAVVKGANAVMGLKKSNEKVDANTVIQAFQSKQVNIGINNKACDEAPAKILSKSWKVDSKVIIQDQPPNEIEPNVHFEDHGLYKDKNGVPAKTSTNEREIHSKTESHAVHSNQNTKIENCYQNFVKAAKNRKEEVSKTNPPVSLKEEPKNTDEKNLGKTLNTRCDLPVKHQEKKSQKVKSNDKRRKKEKESASNSTSEKEKLAKKKARKKEKKEKNNDIFSLFDIEDANNE